MNDTGLTMAEAAIVESCYFQPHYSGSGSVKFWREVKHSANDRTLYDFACALQSVETHFLAVLNEGVRVRARKLVMARRRKTTRRKPSRAPAR